MKRSAITVCEEEEFGNVPNEIVQLIIVSVYHETSQLSTVSKRWHVLLEDYGDWFALAQYYYPSTVNGKRRSHDILPIKSIIEGLVDKNDQGARKFRNYIGRQLCSKHRHFPIGPPVRGRLATFWPLLSSICAYVKEHSSNPLTLKNFHPRDIHLNFTEVGHRYSLVLPGPVTGKATTYQSVKTDDNEAVSQTTLSEAKLYAFLSVTTFIHTLFPQFDAEAVITKMMAADKWEDPVANAYYGMTREEIMAQWTEIGEIASIAGTAMHANLEMYYSGRPYVTDTKEFRLFQGYEAKYVTGKWLPYRTEWTVYSEPLQLCGSIDMLYEYVNEVDHGDAKKHLVLCDWKRSKNLVFFNSYQSGSIPCTESMGDTNFIHYCIQLSLYKYILEMHYNVIIDEMYIVVLHPNLDRFNCVPVNWEMIKPYFSRIIDYRLASI